MKLRGEIKVNKIKRGWDWLFKRYSGGLNRITWFFLVFLMIPRVGILWLRRGNGAVRFFYTGLVNRYKENFNDYCLTTLVVPCDNKPS